MKKTLIALATVASIAGLAAGQAEAKSKIHVDFGINLGNGIYLGGGSHHGYGYNPYYDGPTSVAFIGDDEPECHWVKHKTKFKIAGRGTVTQIEKKWVCD